MFSRLFIFSSSACFFFGSFIFAKAFFLLSASRKRESAISCDLKISFLSSLYSLFDFSSVFCSFDTSVLTKVTAFISFTNAGSDTSFFTFLSVSVVFVSLISLASVSSFLFASFMFSVVFKFVCSVLFSAKISTDFPLEIKKDFSC